MKKLAVLIILVLSCLNNHAQELKRSPKSNNTGKEVFSDSSKVLRKKRQQNIKANIEQYLVIDNSGNTSHIDTSLTIQKEYKFNYLRKDYFGLLPFANLGQTYNQLTKNFQESNLLPKFGARARHFNYLEIEDINYYEVPTPLTELFFKTAFQQGQLLDAFFTSNLSKQFNFSMAYKGLRSLGNYQHQITSTGNLRFTANYKTKDDRYTVIAHITTQDLLNEENGGLKDDDIPNYLSGDEDFLDRSVFDPNFQDAESILVGKRFHLDHIYQFLTSNDSITNTLALRNVISFEDKYFQYEQSNSNDFFGSSFNDSNVRERVTLENFHSQLSLEYQSQLIGNLSVGLNYNDINYGYNKVTILNDENIPNRIKDQIVGFDASYSKQFGKIFFQTEIGANISSDFDGNYFSSLVNYELNDDVKMSANLTLNSAPPNYNVLLYQSDYINYNWNNTDSFNNQKNYDLKFDLKSKKLLNLSLQFTTIDNFTYFSTTADNALIRPSQLTETISLMKLRVDKELRFGKFALDNSILYQKVNDASQSLNLPELVIRNTIYYSNHFFKKKALFLQSGITFNYFTDYYMDGYNPLLAEFYSQNQTKLGGFPRLDFFINAKIRQTRIFFKAEHFNSSFTGYNYFSAPNNPYRDFTVRFGLVWNFFL